MRGREYSREAQAEDLVAYFVPGVTVPLLVAPPVIHVLLDLALALDAAHAQSARQQEQLPRVQQLDLVGRLASGIAHDFNNLLTVVRANVHALGGAASNDELAAIDDAAVRGARLTRRLLSIGCHDGIVLSTQSLAPLLRETEELLRRVLPTDLRLEMPADVPDCALDLDRDAIQQVLLNLALDARDAMDARGALTLSVQRRQTTEGQWLVVAVRESGPGMSADVLARATEPFFTTKAAHQGTGPGLAIVHRSMEQHGGRLTLESEVGIGTCAALWFPVSTAEPSRPPSESTPGALPAASHPASAATSAARCRLLAVDDEPAVRLVTERNLTRLGHHVTSASNLVSAMALLQGGTVLDAIISDVMMPGGTGIDLSRQLRRSGNRTPVLLVSGFSVDTLDATLERDPTVAFIAKPWTLDEPVAGIEGVRQGAGV